MTTALLPGDLAVLAATSRKIVGNGTMIEARYADIVDRYRRIAPDHSLLSSGAAPLNRRSRIERSGDQTARSSVR
ncbi:MAG TPA: hypothetical protein VFC01_15420 [Mycobacterium sp.]|nr:hypothetical protein [Mycobacterium sp.]